MTNKQACIRCFNKPENVLVLTCDHTMCLPCSSNFVEGTLEERQISCIDCGEVTFIDSDIQRELKPHRDNHMYFSKSRRKSSENQHSQNRKKKKKSLESNQQMCDTHPQYSILYFCKTCEILTCPQCIIHGKHKSHNTNTILKQGESIKQKIEEQYHRVKDKLVRLKNAYNDRQYSLQIKCDEILELQKNAQRKYRQIQEAIHKEETQVLSKCEEMLRKNQEQQSSFKKTIQREIKSEENYIKTISSILEPFLSSNIMEDKNKCQQRIMAIKLIDSYSQIQRKENKSQKKLFFPSLQSDNDDILDILNNKVENFSLSKVLMKRQPEKQRLSEFQFNQNDDPWNQTKKAKKGKERRITESNLPSTPNNKLIELPKNNYFRLI